MKHFSIRNVLAIASMTWCTAASAVNAYIDIRKPETCGNSNGELYADLSGNPLYNPLSYLWSNGATTQTVAGLAAGNYSVTITDGQGTQFVANADLPNVNALPTDGSTSPSYGGIMDLLGFTGGACPGECNGYVGMPMLMLGGSPPFTIDFSVPVAYVGESPISGPVYSGFCAQDLVDYTITDAFGCLGTGSFEMAQIDGTTMPSVQGIEGACSGADIGSISLSQNFGVTRFQLYFNGNPIGPEVTLLEFETHVYENLAAGSYELTGYPMLGQCPYSVVIEVPDLGPGCTEVNGTSWYDADGDCVLDAGEIGVPGSVLVIEPGTQYAITGFDGSFSFNLPLGNYTLAQTDPDLDPYCPATMPALFTVNGPVASIDLANNSTAPLDMRIHAGALNARPGFPHTVYATALNASVQPTGLVTVVVTLDPNVVYQGATPVPTSVAGQVITWELPELDWFGTQSFAVQTTVPVSTPIGTLLTHSTTVSSAGTDAYLSNNTDQANRFVQGSYDPNDKTAATSTRTSDELYLIDQDAWIDYTIRFQNTGTAEAFFVTLTDTLTEELDMTTFEMGTASHAHTVTFKPGRVVEWFFDDIMLPDSSSDEAGSHGFVKFRIRPQASLLSGTVIENTANIYFDFNEPVITEPSVLVAEFSTGVGHGPTGSGRQLSLLPNPAIDRLLVCASDGTIEMIILVAADGREVLRHSTRAASTTLDVSGLASGSYLLIAILNNGSVARGRFMKH